MSVRMNVKFSVITATKDTKCDMKLSFYYSICNLLRLPVEEGPWQAGGPLWLHTPCCGPGEHFAPSILAKSSSTTCSSNRAAWPAMTIALTSCESVCIVC